LNAAILLRLRTGRLAGFIEPCQPSAGIKPPSDPRLEATRKGASQNSFCALCFIPSDRRLVVQNHVQQGIVDFQFSVVFDETQFAEFVHEKTHARPGGADHLRQHLLTKCPNDRFRPAFLAEIRQEKEKPGEALFARIYAPALGPGATLPA
jgi:hypothetical protein